MLTMLEQFLHRSQIAGGRMLVGVSGGADSVALLRGLAEVAPQHRIDLFVGHYDHGLRPDSADDAHWVAALCGQLAIPLEVGRSATSDAAESTSEEHFRKRRYSFLARVARQLNCCWIAVAHTADDQTETILHHLVRGSGLKGLSGIPAERPLPDEFAGDTTSLSSPPPRLIRPLLQTTRREVLEYLQNRGQNFRVDSTNQNRNYTRNRIRHEILPLLRQELNPRVDDALQRLARQAAEVQSALEILAAQLLSETLLECRPQGLRLQRSQLRNQPAALLREMYRRLWDQQHWPRQNLTFAHLDELAAMTRTGHPERMTLPGGLQVWCRENVLEFQNPAGAEPADPPTA